MRFLSVRAANIFFMLIGKKIGYFAREQENAFQTALTHHTEFITQLLRVYALNNNKTI